jgi:general secretion pathway protein L
MADWFLLRLPREPDTVAAWMVADSSGRMVLPPQSGSLMQAAALAAGRRVCVLVPGADVLLTEAEVPAKTAAAKILQVVPFALEEQLAEDIEDLHFAVGKRHGDSTRMPVAVVSRPVIENWLITLRTSGISPEIMYADSELIPANPGQSVALLDGDGITVRPSGSAAVNMPIDALTEALELARVPEGETPAEGAASRSLLLYTGAAEWHQHAKEVEALREKFDGIKVQLLTGGPLALFAQQLPTTHSINLLQGLYAPTSTFSASWKSWRIAALLLAGLVMLHIGGRAAELFALKRTEKALDASIAETFRSAMPGEQSTLNARRRMEQRLLAAQNGGDGGLLAALDALAQARGTAPEATVQALSFREGALDLKLTAPDANSLDRISQSLRAGGWQADLTSGNAAENGYEGRIQIKPRGS